MTLGKKPRISDKKAIAAMRLIRRYCGERPCNSGCAFCSDVSGACTLKVRSPEQFTTKEEKKCKLKSLAER